jgi:hypothetical protein
METRQTSAKQGMFDERIGGDDRPGRLVQLGSKWHGSFNRIPFALDEKRLIRGKAKRESPPEVLSREVVVGCQHIDRIVSFLASRN